MLVKEYRIPLPFTLDEFERGQVYTISKMSLLNTGSGEGVQVVRQEPFTSTTVRPGHRISGVYTHKIYHVRSKVPYVFRRLLPDAAFVLHEESWNAFPYIKTVVRNPGYMKENFYAVVETLHCADRGTQANVHNVSNNSRQNHDVLFLDIVSDSHLEKEDVTTDLTTFRSTRTGRGPLMPGWHRNHHPVICAYKLVTIHFKWLGLQNRAERSFHSQYARMFTKLHREAFGWIDEWHGMSMADLRQFEDRMARSLQSRINEPADCDAAQNADEDQSESTDESDTESEEVH